MYKDISKATLHFILLLDIIIMKMKKYIKRLKITLMEISKMKNSTLLKKKQKMFFFFENSSILTQIR